MAADAKPSALSGRESASRFAQRVRAERRRRRQRWLAVAGIVGMAVAAVVGLSRSPLLRVETVVVTGANRSPVPEILAVARVDTGQPMWTVHTAAVRRRVAALARIRSVTVVRSWPRTVRIEVTERTPVAVVAPGGGPAFTVDSGAAEIEQVTAPPAGLLPISLTPPKPLVTANARRPLVTAALSVAAALPPVIRVRVASVRVTSTQDVALLFTDRTLVKWGSADRSQRKVSVLSALLAVPHAAYDVSAPDSPAVR